MRTPLPHLVFLSSKLVNVYQVLPQGECPFAASPWRVWVAVTCWEHRALLPNISQKMDQGFPMASENCPNLPLLSKSSPGFLALPQSRSFPKALQESLCPKAFLKNPCDFPVPPKYPCIRGFRAISPIFQEFLNLESSAFQKFLGLESL